MFGRKKQEPKPEPQLTEAEVASVKKCHAEQLRKKRLEVASCKAKLMIYGGKYWARGYFWGFGWTAGYDKEIKGIPKSLKLTKTQKEALKTHIASWLNEADWFKPE